MMPDLFSRGGARKCLTATFKALTAGRLGLALTKKKFAHDIKEYRDAGHAFMNPHQAGGPVFGTLLR